MRLHNDNDLVWALSMGPGRQVKTWRHYYINGFNFHTHDYGKNKATINYGICVKSHEDVEYFGVLQEVIELVYYGKKEYKIILFKCDWMNSVNGMNVHEQYKLVVVNHTRKYPKYDPFILAYQAQQVYFAPYLSLRNDRKQWWAMFKVKVRSTFEIPPDSFFQEDIIENPVALSDVNDDEGQDEEVEEEV